MTKGGSGRDGPMVWFPVRVPVSLKKAYEDAAREMNPPTTKSALARWVLEEWIAGRTK